jgi:hypothetical protein
MVRLRRALNENTAYAATFISLALFACSGGDGSSAPITPEEMSPETMSPGTPAPANGGGAGLEPVNTETPPLVETPEGEENPMGVPLTPPTDEGDGEGTTPPVVQPPPVVPPPVVPPPEEPPPVVGEPPVEPPPVQTPVFAEDTTQGCVIPALPNFDALPASNILPDPFRKLDGTRVSTLAEWRCRRAEIMAQAERYIYGTKPPKPAVVSGTVSNTNITVNVQNATFSATITMPQGATGPVPAIIAFGGSNYQNTILQEGVAFINFNNNTVGNTTKQGAFYTANPGNQGVGNLMAWAWGVSRMIDVIEASGAQLINPQAIGVTGCSRNGKGAFVAGAFDERVALTIPFESGMAGVAPFRLVAQEAGAENPRNAISYEPWAGSVFEQFAPNEGTARQLQARLPVDTHEVVGLIAPRGLYIMGNPGIPNLAPNSELVGALAGAEIYAALGVEENISYHTTTFNGTHCAFRAEHAPLLQQNIRKFLKKETNATTGEINPDARLTGQLAPSINWQTPTLE